MRDRTAGHADVPPPLDGLADMMGADILDLSDEQFIQEMRTTYGDEQPLIDKANQIFERALNEFIESTDVLQSLTAEVITFAKQTSGSALTDEDSSGDGPPQPMKIDEFLRSANRRRCLDCDVSRATLRLRIADFLETAFALALLLLCPFLGWAVSSYFSRSNDVAVVFRDLNVDAQYSTRLDKALS